MRRNHAVPCLVLAGVAVAAVALTVGCGVTPGDGLAATPTHYTLQYDITVDPGTGEMTARLFPQQTRNVEAGIIGSPIVGPLTCKMTNYGAAWLGGSPAVVNAKFVLNHDIKRASDNKSMKLLNLYVTSEFPPELGGRWNSSDPGDRDLAASCPLAALTDSQEFSYTWTQNLIKNPTVDGLPKWPLGFVLTVEFDAQ